jgi:lipoprotein Spr
MSFRSKFAAQALALVGTPFRLHGRDATTGLDCVGLVVLAAERAGWRMPRLLPAYSLRGTSVRKAEEALSGCGLVQVQAVAEGAILLAESGPMQLHLMVQTGDGIVHAHAGLGRVVLTPPPSLWPLAGVWRFPSFTDQE